MDAYAEDQTRRISEPKTLNILIKNSDPDLPYVKITSATSSPVEESGIIGPKREVKFCASASDGYVASIDANTYGIFKNAKETNPYCISFVVPGEDIKEGLNSWTARATGYNG